MHKKTISTAWEKKRTVCPVVAVDKPRNFCTKDESNWDIHPHTHKPRRFTTWRHLRWRMSKHKFFSVIFSNVARKFIYLILMDSNAIACWLLGWEYFKYQTCRIHYSLFHSFILAMSMFSHFAVERIHYGETSALFCLRFLFVLRTTLSDVELVIHHHCFNKLRAHCIQTSANMEIQKTWKVERNIAYYSFMLGTGNSEKKLCTEFMPYSIED